MQQDSFIGILQRFLFALVLLAGIILFFYQFENWRGKRAWKKFVQEMEAQGERLDWQAFVPRKVPDEDNFAATPLLDAIAYKGRVDPTVWSKFQTNPLSGYTFDCSLWKKGKTLDLRACSEFLNGASVQKGMLDSSTEEAKAVLAPLSILDPEFSELRQAARRPLAQLRGDRSPSGPVPDFVKMRDLGYLLALRTSAELALGKTDDAFADALVIQRLAKAFESEPYLVGTMIGCALAGNMGLQTFWEGLAGGKWSEAQLGTFQQTFHSTDLPSDLDRALRGGERAGFDELVQSSTHVRDLFNPGSNRAGFGAFVEQVYYGAWPKGWVYRNQVVHNRVLQETALSGYDVPRQRVFPSQCRENNASLIRAISSRSPFTHLAAVGLPNFTRATEVVARTQTAVNQAAVACALELYRRAHHEYPPELPALMPQFADALPHDLIIGKSLQYRRVGEKYLLYSVGWDEVDNGGRPEPVSTASPSTGRMPHGDWVWPLGG